MRVFDSRKLLTVGALLIATTLAVNGATSKDTVVVKDVSFNSSGESLEVRITTSEPAKYTYFELSGPHRLVVDFHDSRNEIGFKEKAVDAAGVERVRTSLFTDKSRKATRIVFDLAEKVPYRIVDTAEGDIRVVFGEAVVAELPLLPAALPSMAAPLSVTAGPPMLPSASESVFSLPILPRSVPMTIAAPEFGAPAPPEALAEPLAAPAALPARTVALEMPLNLTSMQTIPAPEGSSPQTPQYTGEIVSFDIRNMDLQDFFQLIADFSGLNVILDPNVSGSVTMTLHEVPWDQALDVVLRNHQLGSQLQGNILRIATNATLQAEENTRRSLRDAQDNAAELQTRTYILNYTTAATVATTLGQILSARGEIIQDARRNALIVSEIPSQLDRIGPLIQFLDAPAPQVEIEARVVSATKSFSRELGNQLGFLLGNNSRNTVSGVGGVGVSPFARTPTPQVNVGGALPLNVNLPAGGTSGISFLLGAGGDIILDEILTAAEAKGTAKVMSRPRVMAQNNLPAAVSNGTQIPVQTNVNNTVTTTFLNFALSLTVTPQITDAGTIVLNAVIENSEPDFARAVNGIPSVSTQRTTTTVVIPDGGTMSIGGILLDTDSVNVRQVPGLGSIPIIGHLFKNTSTVKSTAELLFFITARIRPQEILNILAPDGSIPPGPQQEK